MPDCPYCRQPAELVTGREVYPNRADLAERRFYRCVPCDARVGTHDEVRYRLDREGNSIEVWEPLGTLANPALRALRQDVHRWLDPIFQTTQPGVSLSRSAAYRWLSEQLGVARFHTGAADEVLCNRAIAALQQHPFYHQQASDGPLHPRQPQINITQQAPTHPMLMASPQFVQILGDHFDGTQTPQAAARPEPRTQSRKGAGKEARQADRGLFGPRKRLWQGPW